MSDRMPAAAGGLAASRRTMLRLGAGGGMAALLPGCASPVRQPAVPNERVGQATVLGVPNERFFLGTGARALEAEFFAASERQAKARGLKSPLDTEWQLLAISGGGENGAFGAGLLCGWSVQGSRPTFDLVTGVSTGALTAPFAFLGRDRDPQLKAVYTELTPADVLVKRGFTAALFDDALADNEPLYKTISRYLDERMLADIGAAYDAGRLLLIGTTHLDAQRPVIWNIGAIARSGHPKAADTIRRILLASAAIPGAFPPSMIDVTLDGVAYQEMHVDGGAFAQTFLYPPSITAGRRERMGRGEKVLRANAWIIRNGRLDPEWAAVERRTLGIAGRAISTMITMSGYNDVLRIYATTQRDKVGFNLAYIGSDFDMTLPSPFYPPYMKALYEYGYQRALRGYDWSKVPPGAAI